MKEKKQWHPKKIKCPMCKKYADFKDYFNGIPQYYCKHCKEVIRWIDGVKLMRVPLPLKVKHGNYYAVFEKKRLPTFWLYTLGIYQDENDDIWFVREWKVTFNKTSKLFRLYVDGKPVFVEEARQ